MDNQENKFFVNLGCGIDVLPGWVNIDLPGNDKADIHCDLEEASIPLDSESCCFVKCSHVLEHINNYIPLMKEIHRILAPGGILSICVPEFPCAASVADPTHVRFFTPHSFTYLTSKDIGYDTSGLQGLFELIYLESIPHDKPGLDRYTNTGQDRVIYQRYFVELECELKAVK